MSTKIKASKLHQATTAIETAEDALADGATGRAHGAALRAIDALHEFVRSIDEGDKEAAEAAGLAAAEELHAMAADDERIAECKICSGPIFANERWSFAEGLTHATCFEEMQEREEA